MKNKATSTTDKIMVITGGTDGIGRELAWQYLQKGWQVAIVGRNTEKGQQFLQQASDMQAGDRATFIQADLSLVSENQRVIRELTARFAHIDVLVLGAQHYRTNRLVTSEGFENTFALYYMSRYILGRGLRDLLHKAKAPLIMNVCGTGIEMGEITWDDVQREHNYDGLGAIMQGSRLNDLLGVLSTQKPEDIRYILFNPGGVATSFSGEYDEVSRQNIDAMLKVATPVSEGVKPLMKLLETPPEAQLSAWVIDQPVSLEQVAFSTEAATKLEAVTESLLQEHTKNASV